MSHKPSVLFVCVHNAGRSQMTAGYLNHLAGGRIEVRSAGSEPADKINPGEQPKILANEAVKASDVVITMGGGDTCPTIPAHATKTATSTNRQAKTSTTYDRSATKSGAGSNT